METEQLQRAIETILFAAGEPVPISRLAFALETDPSDIEKAGDALADDYAFQRRGIRILKLDRAYQMVSSGEMADFVTKAGLPAGGADHHRLLPAGHQGHGGADPGGGQLLFRGGAAEQEADCRGRTVERSRAAHSVSDHGGFFADFWHLLFAGAAAN